MPGPSGRQTGCAAILSAQSTSGRDRGRDCCCAIVSQGECEKIDSALFCDLFKGERGDGGGIRAVLLEGEGQKVQMLRGGKL